MVSDKTRAQDSSAVASDLGKQNWDACLDMQKGLINAMGTLNQDWSARANAEVTLMSDLAEKLIAARTVPEAAAAYQDWMMKRMEMLAEDGRRLMASGQSIMKSSGPKTP